MYGEVYTKIVRSLPVTMEIKESTIARIIYEIFSRMEFFEMDKSILLRDGTTFSFDDNLGEIDLRDNNLMGIYWSFCPETGELVGT